MAGMAALDDDALDAALADLPGWSRDGDVLVRTIRCRNWTDAIAFLDAVAAEAERRDHHPDVCVTDYRDVTFRLTTHSEGGITDRDVSLARRVDELAARA